MTDLAQTSKPIRREQAITHAADLLRDGGPRALTSVAVARRMGITQSGVYRHVRNMGELSGLAAERVVAELNRSLHDLVFDPGVDWEAIDDVNRLCRDLVDHVVRNQRSFDVMSRWRFIDGELGIGIRKVIAHGCDLIAELLESRWRIEFGHEAPLGQQEQAAVHAHARAIHDDGYAVARLGYSPTLAPLDLDDVAMILVHRLMAGWASFVIDMNERVGLPYPRIDLAQGIVEQ